MIMSKIYLKGIVSTILLLFGVLSMTYAQTISGKVTAAADGTGIPGASIIVKGTTTGTSSDINGDFQLALPESAEVLVVSYIGYQTQELEIGNQTTFNIALEEDLQQLSEVVVVGYGTQERRDLTGAVSSLAGDDLKNVAITTVEQGLQGRVAGVNIQQSGRPGGAMDVQIRGVGSIGNSQPLYVIDGVPIINDNLGNGRVNALANISPTDIESIEILKDASASAIYGARAANGVVLITTKRGKAGETKVTLNSYYGTQSAWRTLELTDINGYKEISDALTDNAGLPRVVALQDPSELVNLTDWQEEIFRPAPIRNVDFGVSGGTENARFNVSLNYFNQDGIVRSTGFERWSLRVNTDFKKGRFKFGETMTVSRAFTDEADVGGIFFGMLHYPPNRPVFDANNAGGFSGNRIIDEQDANNPVGVAEMFDDQTTRYRILGTVFGEYEIIDGLKYKLSLGGDIIASNRYSFRPIYQFGDRRSQPFATLSENNGLSVSPLIENTLTYSKNFGTQHSFEAVAGYTRQTLSARFANAEGRNTVNDIVRVLNGVNDVPVVSGTLQEFALVSYLGRINYSFGDRYLLTANIRRDGSSRFSPGNKWGVFPSVSVGWRISEEAFMQDVNLFSDLKLRAGWGETGFQEIGNYSFQPQLVPTLNYIFNGQLATGVGQRALVPGSLQWETSTQTNVGLDVGLFDNKLLVNMDYFVKQTDNILIPVPPPVSTGVPGSPTRNVGSVRNSGFEFAATYRKSFGDFQYSVTGNFATLNNEFLDLGGAQPIVGGSVNVTNVTRIDEGIPIGSFWGYTMDGIFQNQAEVDAHATQPNAQPGDIRFVDINGDGVINPDDRGYIGDPIPDLTYGLTLSASYKGFDFNMFVQGVQGVELYYGYRYFSAGMLRPFNFEQRTLGYWQGEGTSNTIPRAVGGDPANNTRESTRFIGDGSFLRARNMTLGYTIPSAVLENFTKGAMSSARFYVTAQNLFTLTSYEGYDPEISSDTQSGDPAQYSRARGIDANNYPQPRTFLFGAQLSF